MVSELKIKMNGLSKCVIEADGQEIKGVKAYTLHQSVKGVPIIVLEFPVTKTVQVDGKAEFGITDETAEFLLEKMENKLLEKMKSRGVCLK
jgi:hypothetical protein